MKRLVWALACGLLAACDLAPKYEPPKTDVPAAYKEAVAPSPDGSWQLGQPAEQQPRGEWWKLFGDPILNDLQAQAQAANPELQAALARVEQARAVARIARADLFPSVGAGFGPTRSAAASIGLVGGSAKPRTIWRAATDISYEFDLFGRIRNGVQAAKMDAEATQAAYQSVLLALQADVALGYLDLRSFETAQRLLQDTVKLREQEAHIMKRRFEEGEVSEVDKARTDAELASTRAELISVEQRLAASLHALAILAGKPPAGFAVAKAPLPEQPPTIPPGLPSTLLERRPDIAAAERAMAAANERIGVARAAFFPRLALTAAGGFEASELSDLFQWSSRTWLIGPLVGTMLTLPVFEGGRNVAGVALAKAEYGEAVANYRSQLLNAFREVEDSLSAQRLLAQQSEEAMLAVKAARRASELMNLRYEEGESSLLEKIDADRTRLASERAALQVRRSRFEATVALIRALGGGWDAPAAAPSAAQPPAPTAVSPAGEPSPAP